MLDLINIRRLNFRMIPQTISQKTKQITIFNSISLQHIILHSYLDKLICVIDTLVIQLRLSRRKCAFFSVHAFIYFSSRNSSTEFEFDLK